MYICIYNSHLITITKTFIIKCISTSKQYMQLEHKSFIYNHQQNPPMYIYTIHIDHIIQQFHQCTNSSSHIFNYDTLHQPINSKYHKFVFIKHTYHQQSSFTCKQLRLMPIMLCAYSRHIYACGTKSRQGRHLRCKISHPSYIITEVKE